MVSRVLTYFVVFVTAALAVRGQGPAMPAQSSTGSFPDSVQTVLENLRSDEAAFVASAFPRVWSDLGIDVQQRVRKQTALMSARKFSLRPHLLNYFSAIVNAHDVERVDDKTLRDFLRVAGRVIDLLPPEKANVFFASVNTFFAHHALHHERTFRLYARDDKYRFDFIEPPAPISWDDTDTGSDNMVTDAYQDDMDSYGGYDDEVEDPYAEDTISYEDEYEDDNLQEQIVPAWMVQEPAPYFEGPVIQFDNVTLNFVTSYDSVFLKNSGGKWSLTENVFVGEGGTFDWSAAGLPADSVYCNFLSYHFIPSKPELKTDLVKLIYHGKTHGFIAGNFEFRSQTRPDSTWSTYPRFRSYAGDLDVAGLGDKNTRYTGGFSLIGNKIISSSLIGEPATVEVWSSGEKKFTAVSPEFSFDDKAITSANAQVRIHQDNDSIVHSRVQLKYSFPNDSTQLLTLRKDRGNMRNAPYASSFFNIDFSADVIQWDLNADSMNIRTDGGRSIVPMIIESVNYYDLNDYRILKGKGFNFHPLALVVNYGIKMGVSAFYGGDLSLHYNLDPAHVKQALLFLWQKGMIVYDERSDLVTIKDKAFTLFMAFKGEKDYDNLKIHSVTSKAANATLNFERRDLTVRGVDEFSVSDSLNVRIEPDSSVITILQNRDIKFDGTVTAGNFEISGKGFTLKYDSFFISLTHIDSINFFVTEKNSRGQLVRRKVNNAMVGADSAAAAAGGLGDISQSSGTLFISRANNKSGKTKLPNYPRLDATTGGVIYFDRAEVLGGVYDRSMFFAVPPFKLDSLNDADPASTNFDGTFVSSGMLPSFKEKLSTQPDKSLGFIHAIPPPGYQLYNGDGIMNGVLSMDNRGLRGDGAINFLAVTVHSRDFVFYPDSVVTRGTRAKIEEKQFGPVKFPQASLPDYDMKWYPKQDRLLLKNLRSPFNFYDSTAQMQGTLTISKSGVAGAGKLETRGTELVSRYLQFNGDDFSARHARFKVKSDDPNKNLLSGDNIRLTFDLDENYADISPEIEGEAAIDFPYAQFKTSIPNARWDLDEQKITMTKDADVPIESSYFYTTRDDLDSLSFNATKAEYNLKTQELRVSGIPHIVVADALITPENNEVLILENARIGTLHNTTIVLDTLNGYHRLTEGVVDVISRKEFRGYATYQYVNFLNDTFAIKLTDFHLEPITEDESRRKGRFGSVATQQTVGTGSVSDRDSLVLGAGMYYKGDMTMYATRPALQLTGYIKLATRNLPSTNWIAYEQSGDETEVFIDFDNAVTETGKRATAGLHFNAVDNSLYITFLNEMKSDDDDDFYKPSGTLFFDNESGEYKIEDLEKAAGDKLSGKVFSYNDETRQVKFEGPINLFQGPKNFNLTATAIGSGNMETNEIMMNAFIMADTDIPSTILDIMARHLQEVIKLEGAEEGLGDQTELLYKIADIVGERMVRDYEERSLQSYVSLATLPPLARPLVFSNVNMKWSAEQKAFYSQGLIGLSNIGKNDINGGFEGFMEVKRDESGGGMFNVFFKASPEAWYYFGFEGSRLLVYSSNKEFNEQVSKKSNAGKAKIGEVAFIPGSDDETLAFINRFRKEYYGIEVPYSLYDRAAVPTNTPDEKKIEDDGF